MKRILVLIKMVLSIVCFLALISIPAYIRISNYFECRAAKFSVMYCIWK